MTITEPKILKGRFAKDFGDGFYCTEIRRQADRWAMRYDAPIVNVYDYWHGLDIQRIKSVSAAKRHCNVSLLSNRRNCDEARR